MTDPARSTRSAAARLTQGLRLGPAMTLSVLASLLWLPQAASIAAIVSGWVTETSSPRTTLIVAAFFLAIAVLRAAIEHRAGRLLFRAADALVARERQRLIDREPLGPATGSAETAALIAQKLPMLQPWITRYRVAMARTAVVPLVILAVSLWHSWTVALVLLGAGPMIPAFMALIGMAAGDASRRQLAEIGTLNGMLMDRLSALLDIRLLGAGTRVTQDFATRADTLRERTMAVLRIAFLSSTVLELFAALGVAMVAVLVGFNLLGVVTFGSWGAPMTLAQGLFLLLLAPEFFQPLRDLAAAWHDRATGLAVATELDALDTAPRTPVLGTGTTTAALPGGLSLRLSGASVHAGDRLLRLPDLTLAPGEAIALTGPSGAGKTTTLRAIAGLIPRATGTMETCGVPLTEATADAWRARLAFMPQQPHFADLTLAEYLDPRDTGADPWPALDLAEAAGIVRRLPEAISTRLGETGAGVSGGEARRLMLARAALTGGDLLLADEPTADLDAETAARIIRALLRLRETGRTLLIATHDPALIAAVDRQVEMPT